MFADTTLAVISLAFPDVCKILVVLAPVPIPLVNIMLSTARLPMVFNVIMGGGMSLNLFGIAIVSMGNEVAILFGAVSQVIVGQGRVMLGSVKVFIGCAPTTRMCDLTLQNGPIPNAVGCTLSCSQVRVIIVM